MVNQFLVIYSWFPLAVLLAILLLISRFYQKLTGEVTRYSWFALPMLLYGLTAAGVAAVRQPHVHPLVELLSMLGGVSLIVLCLRLYRQMTAER